MRKEDEKRLHENLGEPIWVPPCLNLAANRVPRFLDSTVNFRLAFHSDEKEKSKSDFTMSYDIIFDDFVELMANLLQLTEIQ